LPGSCHLVLIAIHVRNRQSPCVYRGTSDTSKTADACHRKVLFLCASRTTHTFHLGAYDKTRTTNTTVVISAPPHKQKYPLCPLSARECIRSHPAKAYEAFALRARFLVKVSFCVHPPCFSHWRRIDVALCCLVILSFVLLLRVEWVGEHAHTFECGEATPTGPRATRCDSVLGRLRTLGRESRTPPTQAFSAFAQAHPALEHCPVDCTACVFEQSLSKAAQPPQQYRRGIW
jgi:hypothetical protein